jgi:hypothetical protein
MVTTFFNLHTIYKNSIKIPHHDYRMHNWYLIILGGFLQTRVSIIFGTPFCRFLYEAITLSKQNLMEFYIHTPFEFIGQIKKEPMLFVKA